MPFLGNKKGSSVTTVENNTRGTNVQPTAHHVENVAKANHWQSVCRSGKWKQLNQGTKSVFKKVILAIEDKATTTTTTTTMKF